jgi:hypothetical protein
MSHIQNEENVLASGEPGRAADSTGHEDSGGASWLAAVGGGPGAILDKINQKLPHQADHDEVIARKFNCRFVWDNECYKKFHLPKHYTRTLEIPWNEARFVTLTFDPLKVGMGSDAYIWFRKNKPLGRFIQNLKRNGINVKDWVAQMEFQRNGTPHFHSLIRTKTGPFGKIGNEVLRKAWPWGYIREEYFKTEKDYHAVVGYFGKAGYFQKGKKYQTELPDYFKSEYFKGWKIIRFYCARRGEGPKKNYEKTGKIKPCISIPGFRSSSCGKYTDIYSIHEVLDGNVSYPVYKFLDRIKVQYVIFKKFVPCDYQNGVGLRVFLSGEIPKDFLHCPF